MKLEQNWATLSLAALSVALTGCDGAASNQAKSGVNSLGAADAIPAHCMPIDEDPGPVLLHAGALPKKRGKHDEAPTGGTTPVTPAELGAPALQPGVGPETAAACGVASTKLPGSPSDPAVVRECFFNGTDTTVQATIERVLESVDDTDLVHVRLTFNPHFVDNSYGASAIGWEKSKRGTHDYKDLVGSDHAELLFTTREDAVALHLKLDYISEDPTRPSGYGSLGVLGGEGDVLVGNAAHVRKVTTSLDRNLNGCGYGTYVESSPTTDQAYTPNPAAPNWDYRVVYEMWIAAEAFGTAGFGGASIEYVHASPSKIGENTLIVDSGPCPPDVPPPQVCPPGTIPREPPAPPESDPPIVL